MERCISERSAFEAWKAAVAGGTVRMPRRRMFDMLDLAKARSSHDGLLHSLRMLWATGSMEDLK